MYDLTHYLLITTAGGIPQIDFSGIRPPGASGSSAGGTAARSQQGGLGSQQVDPYVLREMIRSNAHEMSLLKQNNPDLYDAISNPNPG